MSRQRSASGFFRVLPVFTVLLVLPGFAQSQAPPKSQNVEVKDAGGGSKVEMLRNAAGQVVETRTIDANGKVRSRNTVEYQPGYYVPQQATVSYYPDGTSIENNIKVTYDPNANFLSELVEQYDQSGKHVSGHKLLHDPVTGEFRCWKWNAGTQKYDRVVCPSGEESGEKPPPLKRISQDEAVKMLQAARAAAIRQQKVDRMTPKGPITPADTAKPTKFAIVLPSALTPGQQVSGSLVEDTHYIRLRPDLIIADVELPLMPGSEAAKLSGWRIEAAGSQPQPADRPFTFKVPAGASAVEVKIYPDGQPAQAVTRSIAIPKSSTPSSKPKSGYLAQAVCVIGDVCPIGGVFDGNATTALASFDDKPAKIVAETNDMAFVRVPDDTPFVRQLLFNEGDELLAFPVVVAQMEIVTDGITLDEFQHDIKQDEHKLVFAGVIAVQNLPEENWVAGMFPKSNLEWARRFVPGFELPHENHAQREEREMMEKLESQEKGDKAPPKEKEEKQGYIVFLLKNTTADIGSWRGSNNQAFVLPLNSESFSQGDYRYKFVIDATKTGTYAMDAALIPFVAPVQGQKFTLPAGTLGQ